jgi:hypothetical protein
LTTLDPVRNHPPLGRQEHMVDQPGIGPPSDEPHPWTQLAPDSGAAPPPRHRGGRFLRWLATGLAGVTATVGAAALVTARRADDRAAASRDRTVQLRSRQRRVERATETANHAADGPIGVAERVIASVSRIGAASGTVLTEAASVDDVLGRAVELANNGNRSGAAALYDGEGADAVGRLERVLTAARVLLVAAQQASAELGAGR